jgi:hypothetical protein
MDPGEKDLEDVDWISVPRGWIKREDFVKTAMNIPVP